MNFNTIKAVRRGNKVESGEKQTPITPLGDQPVPGARAERPRPHQPAQDPALSLRYAGELLAAFIKQAGGSVKRQDLDRTRARGP